jgi:hypothetical protein
MTRRQKVGAPAIRAPWAIDRKRQKRLALHLELAAEQMREAAHIAHTLKTEAAALDLKAAIDTYVQRRLATR